MKQQFIGKAWRLFMTAAIQCMFATLVKAELGVPEDIEFKARVDGSAQRYVQLLPKNFNARESHDVLIALHGHGSDRWQYINDGRGECKAARDFADQHGMIFVGPDYRATTSWMGPKAEADLVQIISDLRKKYKVSKIFLVGASMGGSSVLTFTALHPDLVAGVASQNGTANHVEYQNFQDAIAASFGGTKTAIPAEYEKRSAEFHPEAFTMPVAFAVGGKDSTVPPDSIRRLARRLQALPKRNVLLLDRPDGGHSTTYADTMKTIDFVFEASANRK